MNDDLEKMKDCELNRVFAEAVAGWKCCVRSGFSGDDWIGISPSATDGYAKPVPRFCSDLGAVLAHIDPGMALRFRRFADGSFYASITQPIYFDCAADSLARALVIVLIVAAWDRARPMIFPKTGT